MSTLVHQRCWHHASRQAVVRCPECHRYYCRECVTEHRGRMICTGCFAAVSGAIAADSRSSIVPWIALAIGGLFIAWFTFYYLGVALARVPSDFFE